MKSLLCIAALVGVGVIAFWPVWLDGQTTMAGLAERGELAEAGYVDEPLAGYAAAARQRGEEVRWNPHNGLGVPVFGGAAAMASPLRLPVYLFPDSALAFDAGYLLRLLVAAAGAFALARRLGVGRPAAVAAGVAFGLTGAFVRQPSWPELDAEVWLPWSWLAADVLARAPGLGALLGYALVVYCTVVGAAPPTVAVAALSLVGFAIWRRTEWRAVGLVRVGVCSVPPVLLASASWLAGLEHLVESVPHPRLAAEGSRWIGWAASGLVLLALGAGLGRRAFLWGCVAAAGAASLAGLAAFYAPAALAVALLAGAGVERLAPAEREPRRGVEVVALLALLVEVVLAGPAVAPRRAPLWPAPDSAGAFRRLAPASYRVLALGGTMVANQNVATGLPQLGLADRRVPRRFAALAAGLPPALLEPGGHGVAGLAPWTEPATARLLDLCNVRYLVLPASGGARSWPAQLEEVAVREQTVVLRRANALPRAFFPRRIERVDSPAEALDQMAGASFEAREVAYLEAAELQHVEGPPSGSARPVAWSAEGRLELSVQASAPGYLVISVLPYPGLRAEIERRGEVTRAELVPADAALSAVAVPRGRCTVRLVYEPSWEGPALWLRIAGALSLLALAVWIARNREAPD